MISIIENTKLARDEHGWLYGGMDIKITKQQIEDIINGKVLAVKVNDEYVVFIEKEDELNEN